MASSSSRRSTTTASVVAVVVALLLALLTTGGGGIADAEPGDLSEGGGGGGETVTLPWCKPAVPGNYTTRSMKVGDTIVFEWFEYHNAWRYPSGSCEDRTDRVFLGEQSPASYEFTEDDVGTTVTFACDVSNHCQVGQFITFDVVSSDDEEIVYDLGTPCGSDGRLASAEVTEPSEDDSGGGGVRGTTGGMLTTGAVMAAAMAATWITAG